MWKRMALTVVLLMIVWAVIDFVIHGVLLGPLYTETYKLWRPMNEMNIPVMYSVSAVLAVCFVLIYQYLIDKKSLMTGIQFGVLLGVTMGASMGFGSYAVMPIPLMMAVTWFLGTIAEMTVAGAIVGAMLKN